MYAKENFDAGCYTLLRIVFWRRPVASRKLTISAIFLFIIISSFPLSAQECPIVINGEPRAVIVFKGEAQAGLAEAISDLKNYISLISGAEIEIKQEPDSEFNSGAWCAMINRNTFGLKCIGRAPNNKFLVRNNVLMKGVVIDTELGKAKIKNRPSQEGSINAVLM